MLNDRGIIVCINVVHHRQILVFFSNDQILFIFQTTKFWFQTDRQTDGRTDGRTDRRNKHILGLPS